MSSRPSLYHVILGTGLPFTWQLSLNGEFTLRFTSWSPRTRGGFSGMKSVKVVKCLQIVRDRTSIT